MERRKEFEDNGLPRSFLLFLVRSPEKKKQETRNKKTRNKKKLCKIDRLNFRAKTRSERSGKKFVKTNGRAHAQKTTSADANE